MSSFIKIDEYWIRNEDIKILVDETQKQNENKYTCTIITSSRMQYRTKKYKCEDIIKMIEDSKKEKE